MIRKLIILLITVSAGFAAVLFIPYEQNLRPASLLLDQLPEELEGWRGVPLEVTEREIELLAADTEMRKKQYFLFEPEAILEKLEGIQVSLVLSGNDLNGSIHRPERCLQSQGHRGLQVETIPIPLDDGSTLHVNRVKSIRPLILDRDLLDSSMDHGRIGEDGTVNLDSITYYWFVGHKRITHDHLERTLMDMEDRLMGGYVQRWAYFSIGGDVTASISHLGRSEERTDEILRTIVKALYKACVNREDLPNAGG